MFKSHFRNYVSKIPNLVSSYISDQKLKVAVACYVLPTEHNTSLFGQQKTSGEIKTASRERFCATFWKSLYIFWVLINANVKLTAAAPSV